MLNFLKSLGVLRTMLLLGLVFLIAVGPFSGGAPNLQGFALITTILAPVFFAIYIFLMPLELTMSYVFMVGKNEKNERLKKILVVEFVLYLVMLVVWIPFVMQLVN